MYKYLIDRELGTIFRVPSASVAFDGIEEWDATSKSWVSNSVSGATLMYDRRSIDEKTALSLINL